MPAILKVFRVAAVLEALSWTGLLVGMLFKYTGVSEAGVHLFGPIHGGMFLLYAVLVLPAARAAGWGSRDTILALLAAIPPFTTLLIERRLRTQPTTQG